MRKVWRELRLGGDVEVKDVGVATGENKKERGCSQIAVKAKLKVTALAVSAATMRDFELSTVVWQQE